ncbi:caspase family protein [Frigidibacter sp. ROC022]|uniref:caspase family protein n=1 Tax=Frigidibacter sp. ROC022 TaxID=2971796 RepID=UPI00215A9D35|nr:caspase family protein [Frigidibacter sp. ROC022]MCR8722962.1 caspase family protein [Frigidibacter sp. ROC022]
MLARFLTLILVVFSAVAALSGAARAKSLALVIGNDAYTEIEPLQKAVADSGGYADLFAGMGFEVTRVQDLTARQMVETLAGFYDSITPGDIVIFVYSGHGWSDGQQNYLVPVDIRAQGSETLLAGESFPVRNGVNGIVDEIARRGPQLTVAIIDACRNNPFTNPQGTRSFGLSRGLVPVQAPTGTFIAFSAGEGQTALDRLSDNDPVPYSVFTRFFLDELAKPQDLQTAFKATQARVNETAKSVGHPQRPAYYDEVIGSACLSGHCATDNPAPPTYLPGPADPVARAAEEWKDFRNSTSIAALKSFAERHKGTPYADLARERIAMLEAQAETPDAPAPRSDNPLRPALPKVDPGAEPVVVVPPIAIAPEPVVVPEPAPEPEPAPAPAVGYEQPEWCPYAATPTEIAICADAGLSWRDIALVNFYNKVFEARGKSGRVALKSEQEAWLARRNRCGADPVCIASAYDKRIAELIR